MRHRAAGARRIGSGLLGAVLALVAVAAPVAPAEAQPAGLASAVVENDVVAAFLPLTPGQARDVLVLLRTPGTIVVDVARGAEALRDLAPALPGALVLDMLTAPVRHLAVLHAAVTDVLGPGA